MFFLTHTQTQNTVHLAPSFPLPAYRVPCSLSVQKTPVWTSSPRIPHQEMHFCSQRLGPVPSAVAVTLLGFVSSFTLGKTAVFTSGAESTFVSAQKAPLMCLPAGCPVVSPFGLLPVSVPNTTETLMFLPSSRSSLQKFPCR